MAERTSDRGRRRRFPLAILGVLAVLVALVLAYLSECVPGLGPGRAVQGPEAGPPVAPETRSEVPGTPGRLTIVVQGDTCLHRSMPAAPCPEVCAALPRDGAATVEVVVEATQGRHGTVEALRTCLQQAGFAKVRVHAE